MLPKSIAYDINVYSYTEDKFLALSNKVLEEISWLIRKADEKRGDIFLGVLKKPLINVVCKPSNESTIPILRLISHIRNATLQ